TAADPSDAPLDRLDALLAEIAPAARERRRPRPVPFAGGVITAIAYETRHAVEKLSPAAREDADAPRLLAALYDAALSYDHRAKRYWLASWHLDAAALAALAEEICDAAADAEHGARAAVLPMQGSTISASYDEATYAARVARIHEYIGA